MPGSFFEEEIDITSVWNETLDQMNDIHAIYQQLQTDHVLWETFAFYDLFFGEFGIFQRQAATQESQEASDS